MWLIQKTENEHLRRGRSWLLSTVLSKCPSGTHFQCFPGLEACLPTWKMGSYWVGSANIVHPVDISFPKTNFSLSSRTTEAGLPLEVRRGASFPPKHPGTLACCQQHPLRRPRRQTRSGSKTDDFFRRVMNLIG